MAKKIIGIAPYRRAFLRNSAAIAPVAVAIGTGSISLANAVTTSNSTPYQPTYFNPKEWTLLQALVDRLIPADDTGPGAVEAGVAEFIDRQMDTPYGNGKLWYMEGPFKDNLPPRYGYQLAYPPRELYRRALAEVDAAVVKLHGKAFDALDAATRDDLMHQIEGGKLVLDSVPSSTFFAQLYQNTLEGYFCDPKYGGNKNMDGWRMVGFPGARVDYMDWVEQYGKPYPFPPVAS